MKTKLSRGILIKVLEGFECEIWKANRRQVLVDYEKRWKIDGITRWNTSIWGKDNFIMKVGKIYTGTIY